MRAFRRAETRSRAPGPWHLPNNQEYSILVFSKCHNAAHPKDLLEWKNVEEIDQNDKKCPVCFGE